MLECLKNCWKNVSEHAIIYWKHVLECSKIVFEKVEKKLKKVEKMKKMFLESSRIWCPKVMTWKKHLWSQIRPQKTKVWPRTRTTIYKPMLRIPSKNACDQKYT